MAFLPLAATTFLIGGFAVLAPAFGAPGLGAPGLGPDPARDVLEPALEAIRPANLHADLFFLASDELGGRDTPSLGQKIAARYLRSRLERLGWQPAAPSGYLYRYWLDYQATDPQGSSLEIVSAGASQRLAFGRDYFFNSLSAADATWVGSVVFCGTGTGEDFEAVAIEGRWALCWASDMSWRKRQVNAKKAGALGLLVTPGPDYAGEPFEERYGEWAESRAQPSWPSRFDREVFPTSYLTADAGRTLIETAATAGLELGQELGVEVRDVRAKVGVGGQIELENVVALWPGSDPELAHEVILISAHYDHVGTNDKGEIYNGADDNGSGSTGLLAVAEALAANGPLRRSVVLMWVSAEEKGLLGSKSWANYPWLPEGYRPICDINIDMIGRNAPDYLMITPTKEHAAYSGLTQLAERLAPLEGFPTLANADEYYNRSDQAMFQEFLDLPVCFFFSDVHADYHKPTDTADKIDIDKMRRVARLVVRLVGELQAEHLEIEAAPIETWHVARARGDLRALEKAAEVWARAHDERAPETLEALLETPDVSPARTESESDFESGKPYFDWPAIPVDPWGRPYDVVRPSEWFDGYEIRSFGRDGEPGGEGEDADLSTASIP